MSMIFHNLINIEIFLHKDIIKSFYKKFKSTVIKTDRFKHNVKSVV